MVLRFVKRLLVGLLTYFGVMCKSIVTVDKMFI